MFLTYAALFFAFFWVSVAVFLLVNRPRVGFLQRMPPAQPPLPRLAIVIAVRNEERNLAEALESVCRLDYPGYEVVVVNDRSTDRTAAILESFVQRYPQLRLLTIDALPAGWLGKNHALLRGTEATDAQWILFTDADVAFAPDTMRRAIGYARTHQLDFLCVLPWVQSRSSWLNAYLATFTSMLEMRQQPWAVRNPKSRFSIGVGAFNLVRRVAYERMGTHQAIALRPDDDLMLGKRIKEAGGRCDVLYGRGQIGLEWYENVGEFVEGLMKNMFSVFDYNLLRMVVTGVFPMLLFFVLPLPVLLLLGGTEERLLALLAVVAQILLMGLHKGAYTRAWHAFLIPVAGLLMVYIMVVSALRTRKQNGVFWRGHFYSLEELRKMKS